MAYYATHFYERTRDASSAMKGTNAHLFWEGLNGAHMTMREKPEQKRPGPAPARARQGRTQKKTAGRGEARCGTGEWKEGNHDRFGDYPRGKGRGWYISQRDKANLHAACAVDELEGDMAYPDPPHPCWCLGG